MDQTLRDNIDDEKVQKFCDETTGLLTPEFVLEHWEEFSAFTQIRLLKGDGPGESIHISRTYKGADYSREGD